MGLMTWKPNKKENLVFIKELIESDKLIPVINKTFPLSESNVAFKYFEEGTPIEKIVITME